MENANAHPGPLIPFLSFQFGGSITGRLKTSLKLCFLKCLLLPVKITYDALTGLISNGDQQRARRASAQASIFIMHHTASPTNLSLSLDRALAICHFPLSFCAFFTIQGGWLTDSAAIQLAWELLIETKVSPANYFARPVCFALKFCQRECLLPAEPLEA